MAELDLADVQRQIMEVIKADSIRHAGTAEHALERIELRTIPLTMVACFTADRRFDEIWLVDRAGQLVSRQSWSGLEDCARDVVIIECDNCGYAYYRDQLTATVDGKRTLRLCRECLAEQEPA